MKKRDCLTAALVCLGLAQSAWSADVISINFGSGQANASMSDQEGNDGSFLRNVPASSWNDFNGNSATDAAVAKRWNGTEAVDLSDVTVSFSGRGGNWYPHAAAQSTASRFLNGYIDDSANNQVSITVKNVPYASYDVIIYYNGDNSGHRFKPVEVNGARYSIENGATVSVAADAVKPIWGLPEQTSIAYGKNAIRISGLTGSNLTIQPGIFGTVDGSQCRGTVAAVQIFNPSHEDIINVDNVYTASAAEALEDADVYNLTIPAGGTFTFDANLTRRYNLISTGLVTLKGANLTSANLGLVSDMTTGFIYRIEGEGAASGPMNFGAGRYSFPAATVGQHDGGYVLYVTNGDDITVVGGGNPPRNGVSYDINGGNVTIGESATGGFWTGVNGSYNQTAGTVTAIQNSENQNGTGDGLLLGYSGSGLTAMNISGGKLLVENSSIQLFLLNTLNLSGTGLIKAKGVFMGNGTDHTIAISDTATFELGAIGWKGVKLAFNGGTLKSYETATIDAPVTLSSGAVFEIPTGISLTLAGEISGDGAIATSGTGTLRLKGAATSAKLGEIAGPIVYVATAEILAEGVITGATTGTVTKEQISVVNEAGNPIDADITIEGSVITLVLNAQNVKTSCDVSSWNPDWTGEVSVKGTEEAPITVNVNAAFPSGVTVLKVFGPVTFAYGSDLAVSPVVVEPQSGSVVTVSGTVVNTIDVPAGATLKTSGSVTFLSAMQVTASGQKNSVVEIAPGSTLTLTANNQLPANVKVNVYGTLDIGETTLSYNNNPGQCEYNFYAGSVMTGTGAFRMTGGYTAKYYVRAYAAAENQYATVDVPRTREYFDCATEVYVDAGVGLKWLKAETSNLTQPVTIMGSDVRGLEIQGATNVKFGDYEKGLKGDLVIGAGAKLTLTRTDSLEYNSANGAAIINLDIAGTLDCGEFRQTLSNSNSAHEAGKMVLRDGGQIVGAGVDWGGTKCALDMWRPATIEVAGTSTITAPVYTERDTSKLTVKPLAENGSGLLVLTQWNANTTIDLQPGAQVQLPDTVDATKVVTTARGMMIASKPAETEGRTVYRTVPKSFTISIR